MERFKPYDDGTKSAAGLGGGMTDTEAAQRQADRLAALDETARASTERRKRELTPDDYEAVLVWEAPKGETSGAPVAPSVYGMSMVAGEVRLTDLVANRSGGPIASYERVPRDPEAVAKRKGVSPRQKQA